MTLHYNICATRVIMPSTITLCTWGNSLNNIVCIITSMQTKDYVYNIMKTR